MALAMSFINEVLRQFDTTVLVRQADWDNLMRDLKLDPTSPSVVLDRMLLRPVVVAYGDLAKQVSELLAENDQLRAKVTDLAATTPATEVSVA